MTKLVWGGVGNRHYETGADRGVLYLAGFPGVVWDGLTSVSENPSGGDPRPYYIDGFKYINLAEAEEFAATISAYSSPTEFARCEGTVPMSQGLYITQQPRVSFGLSYRTLIGNDVNGLNHGYKIHLVYNALAAPADRDNSSISDSPEPLEYSWEITTAPPKLSGYRPSAHLIVDTTVADPADVTALENQLYGTSSSGPTLPTQAAVIAIFS